MCDDLVTRRSALSLALVIGLLALTIGTGSAAGKDMPAMKTDSKKKGDKKSKGVVTVVPDGKTILTGEQAEKEVCWDLSANPKVQLMVSQYVVPEGKTLRVKTPGGMRVELKDPKITVRGRMIIGDPEKERADMNGLDNLFALALKIELDGPDAVLEVHGVYWMNHNVNFCLCTLRQGTLRIRDTVVDGTCFEIADTWKGEVDIRRSVFQYSGQGSSKFTAKQPPEKLAKAVSIQECVIADNYRFGLEMLGTMKKCDILKYGFLDSTENLTATPFKSGSDLYFGDKDFKKMVENYVRSKVKDFKLETADKPNNDLKYEKK